MPDDPGLDIDYDDPAALDRELAALQAQAAPPAPDAPAGPKVVKGEAVSQQGTIEFMGARFRIASKIGLMPLLKFSAHSDMSTSDPRALGAMYAMLKDCIHGGTPGCGDCAACDPERCGECRGCERQRDGAENSPCWQNVPDQTRCRQYDAGDWRAFEEHAIDSKAEADDLLDVITAAIELISGRPTGPPSSSSPGPRAISGGSTGRSSGRRAKGSRR